MTDDMHDPVLLKESVDALLNDLDGIYVDGTFGRGGHSREILRRLGKSGRLVAFDKDPVAVEAGRKLEAEDQRFTMIHGSFAGIKSYAPAGDAGLSGILLDLGVSSPQLDNAERGFSFSSDGPLDMRMNNLAGASAAEWLARASEDDIATVLKEYGEERFARRMARAIVEKRRESAITRTQQLAGIVSAANPRWEKGKHPATRAFQAIRIFVNRELEDLQDTLSISIDMLRSGGRMVVISFHSLEDRIVKRFFREQSRGKSFPRNVPVTEEMLGKTVKIIGKALRASDEEVAKNVRSRSAVMRVAERIG